MSVQRPVLQRVPTPPLLRHQSPPPSAPPSASAGQRAGAGGLGSRTLTPGAAGPRGSAAPGTSVSTSHGVSGGGGQRPRPCRLLSPGIHRCFSCPSAPAATPEGTPRPGRPGAPGRAAPAQGPEAQSPPLRPAPSVGLGPEGGSREGRETGSSPPTPPLSPPGTSGGRPGPRPASPPRHTRPAGAAIGGSPALGPSTSGPRVRRARAPPTRAGGGCACAGPGGAHAPSAAISVPDVWGRWREEGEGKVRSTDVPRYLAHERKKNTTNQRARWYPQ